jgi:hypothetical protein
VTEIWALCVGVIETLLLDTCKDCAGKVVTASAVRKIPVRIRVNPVRMPLGRVIQVSLISGLLYRKKPENASGNTGMADRRVKTGVAGGV